MENGRRALLKGLAVGAVLPAAAPPPQPATDTAAAVPAFRGRHQPKPLPFDPAKLKGLSEHLLRSGGEA